MKFGVVFGTVYLFDQPRAAAGCLYPPTLAAAVFMALPSCDSCDEQVSCLVNVALSAAGAATCFHSSGSSDGSVMLSFIKL